ncbi:DMT family transporter [Ectobacillus sp. JY-23]|uniref:DMT family transporter n=1 Tax=Ectobacillus sp. JY-23 TaxID=2933872 RepID=UPI001FF3F944|nr:DMT family transporter [Ectobacillus sp. JY-23]UOY92981.1 DMT family transporter [Ectobacillus sp. JY-23]
MDRYYVGVICIILSAIGFGMMPIFALYAYEGGINVTALLFFRFLFAALLFFLYSMMKKLRVRVGRKECTSLIVLGGGLYTIQSLTYFSSIQYIPSSLAALLLYMFPIFVTLLSFVLEGEAVTRKTVSAIVLSLGGLVLVLGASFDVLKMSGVIYAIAAAVVYSLYIVYSNRVLQTVSPIVTSGYIALFAAASLFGVSIWQGTLSIDFSWRVWLPVAAIVFISTVMTMLTFFKGLSLIGSTKSSIISMIEPLVTIGLSAAFLGERLSQWQMLGGMCVLSGALLVIIVRGHQTEAEIECEKHTL